MSVVVVDLVARAVRDSPESLVADPGESLARISVALARSPAMMAALLLPTMPLQLPQLSLMM